MSTSEGNYPNGKGSATRTNRKTKTKTMNAEQIKEILAKHGLWLSEDPNGMRADLTGADLTGADLIGANLTGANLTGADLTWANIPKIERLHSKILEAINAGGKLEMDNWHTCETTHCRSGWAIQLAGELGKRLEESVGSNAAGALIFAASYPDQNVPDFYATNEDAMADIERCAMEESV